ncbi:MAG: methyltransferase domain-containing protein [Planctomycetota bacterium]|nr:methyltransferase domain-containing protein [Planctomycetota bacterium]
MKAHLYQPTALATPARIGTLPFDQEQRYRTIGALLAVLRRERGPLSVLDVGGRTGALRDLLDPEDQLVLVDPDPSESDRFVLGLGEALPFAEGSFDVVVAADILEHVPQAARERFVRECTRVTRGWTILAGPYHHPRVAEAEQRLAEFVRERLGAPHRYLEEHLTFGLPDRERVEQWCRAAGAHTVRSLGHGNLERWLGLMCVSLMLDRDPATRAAAERFHSFYNHALLPEDRAGVVYRHAVVAVKQGPIPPSAEQLFASAEVDPRAQEAALSAIDQLLAFDQSRDILHAERARLEGEITRRDADLLDHASALRSVREDLAAHRLTLGETLGDLAGHSEALSDQREELQALRAELDTARADARSIEAQLLRKTRWRRRFWHLVRRPRTA